MGGALGALGGFCRLIGGACVQLGVVLGSGRGLRAGGRGLVPVGRFERGLSVGGRGLVPVGRGLMRRGGASAPAGYGFDPRVGAELTPGRWGPR